MSTAADLDQSMQFDIIVANPPHFNRPVLQFDSDSVNSILFADDDWQIHKNFFADIKKNLAPDGVILLQESYFGSCPQIFQGMIEKADLKISRYIDAKIDLYPVYYLEIKHK